MGKRFQILFLTGLLIGLAACGSTQEAGDKTKENSEKETLENANKTPGGVAAKEEEQGKRMQQNPLTSKNNVKKILYENASLNEVKEFENVKVTLKSVQYAEITPTETSKPIHENGVVVLTMKLKLENHSNQLLNGSVLGTILRVNNNQTSYLSQSSLEPDKKSVGIDSGTSNELLRVFLIDKKTYSQFRKLKLEFGPLRNMEGKELYSGKQVEFDIPVPS